MQISNPINQKRKKNHFQILLFMNKLNSLVGKKSLAIKVLENINIIRMHSAHSKFDLLLKLFIENFKTEHWAIQVGKTAISRLRDSFRNKLRRGDTVQDGSPGASPLASPTRKRTMQVGAMNWYCTYQGNLVTLYTCIHIF